MFLPLGSCLCGEIMGGSPNFPTRSWRSKSCCAELSSIDATGSDKDGVFCLRCCVFCFSGGQVSGVRILCLAKAKERPLERAPWMAGGLRGVESSNSWLHSGVLCVRWVSCWCPLTLGIFLSLLFDCLLPLVHTTAST